MFPPFLPFLNADIKFKLSMHLGISRYMSAGIEGENAKVATRFPNHRNPERNNGQIWPLASARRMIIHFQDCNPTLAMCSGALAYILVYVILRYVSVLSVCL